MSKRRPIPRVLHVSSISNLPPTVIRVYASKKNGESKDKHQTRTETEGLERKRKRTRIISKSDEVISAAENRILDDAVPCTINTLSERTTDVDPPHPTISDDEQGISLLIEETKSLAQVLLNFGLNAPTRARIKPKPPGNPVKIGKVTTNVDKPIQKAPLPAVVSVPSLAEPKPEQLDHDLKSTVTNDIATPFQPVSGNEETREACSDHLHGMEEDAIDFVPEDILNQSVDWDANDLEQILEPHIEDNVVPGFEDEAEVTVGDLSVIIQEELAEARGMPIYYLENSLIGPTWYEENDVVQDQAQGKLFINIQWKKTESTTGTMMLLYSAHHFQGNQCNCI
jgi:hypothetical protein